MIETLVWCGAVTSNCKDKDEVGFCRCNEHCVFKRIEEVDYAIKEKVENEMEEE